VFRQPQGKNSGNEGKVGTATTGSIENMPAREEQSVTHLAAAPISPANADVTGALTPSPLGRGYAVQVTSERSEARAQAAFRALQAKYPNQLGGRQLIIRRTNLGASGIYYRALVGPFASAEMAARMCSGLKAAGGDCIIQKN
jgi:SPOR domain